MKDAEKTIGSMIDKTTVSIVSSVDEDGFPNTKAMLPPRKRDGIKHIFFTTNTSSMRVKQYSENPKACIYFFDKRFFRGNPPFLNRLLIIAILNLIKIWGLPNSFST